MKYEVELTGIPAGISAHSADVGEAVQTILSDSATDSDGFKFYAYVEMLNDFLEPFFETGGTVSTIDRCFILIKEKKATVYINEFSFKAEIIPAKEFQAGATVFIDGIAGVTKFTVNEISIPPDHGIIVFFSHNWKRVVFFDFSPLHAPFPQLLNVEHKLAALYESILFYRIYLFSSGVWEQMYALGWFPFISTFGRKLEGLLSRVSEGRSIQNAECDLIDSFDEIKMRFLMERFKKQSVLEPHIKFFVRGIEHYIAKDYISSISVVWSRIEGILRYAFSGPKKPSQKSLTENIVDIVANQSILPEIFFPYRFRDYLLAYYFRDFDLAKQELQVSRHSVGHGVADPATYDQKRALIGILIVDQLVYYLQPRENSKT